MKKQTVKIRLFQWPIPAFICILIFHACFFMACAKQEKESKQIIRPVKIMEIRSSGDNSVSRMPGKVRASKRVDLAFKVSGPLIEFPVREGMQVNKGDILARIDPRDFETNLEKIKSAENEAQAKFRAMQSGARAEDIKVLEAEVSAAKAHFEGAQLQHKRYASLYAEKNISKSEYDRVKTDYQVARANLKTAVQNLEKGKKGARPEDIEAMQAQIRGLQAKEEDARNALDDTFLRAPFQGVIAKKYVENFQEVNAKQPVVSLQDITKIEILVNVPEVLAVQAKNSVMEAFAEFSAAPGKQYPLKLKEFSTQADPNTQTYQAVLEMNAPESLNILPGMTAMVKGTLTCSGTTSSYDFLIPICRLPEQQNLTVQIPSSAVFADETNQSYVWVVDPDTMQVSRREVSPGNIIGENIVIVSGLQEEDRIVTAGVHYLQEGQKVKALQGKIGD